MPLRAKQGGGRPPYEHVITGLVLAYPDGHVLVVSGIDTVPAMYGLVVLLFLVVGLGTAQADQPSGLPPTAAFASLPRIESIQISPSGRHLAVLRNHDGKTYLGTQTVTGQDVHRLVSTDNRDSLITSFRWINDERVLVTVSFADSRDRIEWVETRLLAINRDGTEQNGNLLRQTSFTSIFGKKHLPQFQDRLVGTIPGDAKHVLIALDIERPNSPDVYALDVYSGERRLVETNPGLKPGPRNVLQWIADREGEVRAGVGQFETTVRVIVKPPESKTWRTFVEYDAAQETGLVPLAFDADPTWLYVRDRHRGRAAIFKVNIAGDPSVDRILVASDPKYDLAGELVYAPGRRKVIGVRYSAEDLRVLFWDFDAQRLQARIDRAILGRANVIHSSSDDGRLHIVKSAGLSHPPQYFIYDEQDGRMLLLGKAYPDLEGVDLPASRPVTFTARDGKELHGLLTIPLHREPDHLPLILFPHGGSASRERDAFNYWTQWLASRGWAVLQVSFRGAEGYGEQFLRAGFQRWNLELQDDLSDAAQWAIHAGLADTDRICLLGSDYGGYAALMGLVKTPDLYRCAVSLGGITDLRKLSADSRWYLNQKPMVEARIGSWWHDRDRLHDLSPITHPEALRRPLLLIHGAMDRAVPVEHSRELAESLKAAHVTTSRYVELPFADHDLSREEDRLQVFSELESFLSSQLN
ncbi:MAG: Dipeptidyl aminopeptidase BIII [Nitrospirae bacterium]|nr:Dipeptidyl aminopeptidase BIII [Nitrospirota bacterium]